MNARRHKYVFINGMLLAVALLIVNSCAAQSDSDAWLILASGQKGLINMHTSRADLARLFGDKNVVDKDVDVGEGETEPGTVVFSNDAERRIEVLWVDPDKKDALKSATITGSKSRWHAAHGITLGASVEDIERVNGRAFAISFGTDEPGAIVSWHRGRLEGDLGNGQVFVTLQPTTKERIRPNWGGDSDTPAMRKLKLCVSKISWRFHNPVQY